MPIAEMDIDLAVESEDPLVLKLDKQGSIAQCNDSLSTLLEYQRHELIGKNWFSLCLAPERRTTNEAIFRRALTTRAAGRTAFVAPIQSKSGRQYALTWYIEPLFNNDQLTDTTLIGLQPTGCPSPADQQALLQSLAQKQAVLDNADEAIISIDTDGLITDVNKSTEKIFGYTQEELIGRNIRCLMTDPDRSQHDGYIKRFLDTGEARIIGTGREVTGLTKDRSEVLIELRVTEIQVNGKRSFTGVLRDITQLRRTETQLREQTEELLLTRERLAHLDRLHIAAEMSTGIAHELNQPLSAIAMYAQAAKLQLESAAPDTTLSLEAISRIDAQVQRATGIIRDLRRLVSKQAPEYEPVDINALITSTVELASTGPNMRQIHIACSLSSRPPMAEVAYSQIQQVLLNLINNARDALNNSNTDDRRIVISSSVEATNIKVSVRDNGDGVSIQHADKLFEPFYSTKDLDQGMGMGLAISRSVIQSHGGRLELNREYQSGAEFFFTLPAKAGRAG